MLEKRFIGYSALFIEVEDKKYYVEFPDLVGCFTQGDTFEEAICNAQEALAIYYAEKKGDLPPASSVETVQKNNPDILVQMIAIDRDNYIVKPLRTINKTLTIPEWLNDLAKKYQVNCSRVLKTALINHLKNLDTISAYDRKMLND